LFVNNFPDSTSVDLNSVSVFHVDQNGALTAATGSPFTTVSAPGFSSNVGLTADHGGKLLFVAAHMSQAVIPFSVYAVSGALAATQPLPTRAANYNNVSCHNNPLRVIVHPSDQFVFASNPMAGTVTAFSVLGNGTLSAISDFPVGQHPFGMALDSKGQFLFVANKMDNTISGFTVNTSSGM